MYCTWQEPPWLSCAVHIVVTLLSRENGR